MSERQVCSGSSVRMSSSENAASHEVCEAESLRIVLLGRTGTGRSSSGNTILGRSAFGVHVSPSSVTTHCRRQSGKVDERSVSVIDTPGFFHTRLPHQGVMAEVGRCVALSSPGPHAFLVTLQLGRFTQEDRDALEWIKATLGPGASRFTMVLFTWGDQLQETHIEDFIQESAELSAFVSSCRGGHHVLHNTEQHTGQVEELLRKVDKMVENNVGLCYTSEMLEEAGRAVKEAQERILGGWGHEAESPHKDKEDDGPESERRQRGEQEERRKRAERLFWCELVTALGKGAAEGAGITGKDRGKGNAIRKVKVVEKAAALAATPLSITSAAKVVGGAVREGGKVLYKHRKTFLH